MSAGSGSDTPPAIVDFRRRFADRMASDIAEAIASFLPPGLGADERDDETARALVRTFVQLLHHRGADARKVISRLRVTADWLEREMAKPTP